MKRRRQIRSPHLLFSRLEWLKNVKLGRIFPFLFTFNFFFFFCFSSHFLSADCIAGKNPSTHSSSIYPRSSSSCVLSLAATVFGASKYRWRPHPPRAASILCARELPKPPRSERKPWKNFFLQSPVRVDGERKGERKAREREETSSFLFCCPLLSSTPISIIFEEKKERTMAGGFRGG